MSKKNVIMIVTDDQTLDTINYLGNKEIITPNLDELCKNGLSFTQAHIPSGTSGAVCMPSRAMIHSSKQPFNLEGCGEIIPTDHITLGQHLIENGYESFGCGKWHNGTESFTRSFSTGDNIFFGGMWDHYNVPVNDYDPSGKYDNKINLVVNFFNTNETLKWQANKFNPGVHSTDLLTKTACDFIRKEHDKPFFLYTALLAPHDPRVMPEEFKDMYQKENIKVPENYLDEHPFDFGQENERDEQIALHPLTKDYVKNERLDYYAMITHIDAELGKIIRSLKESNNYENSIIIFTSDNGLSIGKHGLMGKQNHYDESIRVPLIISGPGIAKDELRNQKLYLMDIYPTLLDILEIEYDETKIDGISFVEAFNSPEYVHRDSLYFAFTHYIRSVKNERFKLIMYRPKEGMEITQMFDLIKDPNETNNIVSNPKYREEKNKLYDLLYEYKNDWEYNEENYFTKKFWNK